MKEGVRVLHVDDDAALLDIAATFLERSDERLQVTTETDPTKIPDIVGDGSVDCVVSDYEMPRMTGLDLLDRLQSEYPDLPFVLFTGTQDADVAVEALRTGATDYCRKQVGTDHYRILAARIVDTVDKHREAERQRARCEDVRDAVRTFAEEVDRIVDAGDVDAEQLAELREARERLREISTFGDGGEVASRLEPAELGQINSLSD
jgi:DNA-binding NtrC family response regulator